jgi:RNA polymerase sigma-70 factor, ECF subfamily
MNAQTSTRKVDVPMPNQRTSTGRHLRLVEGDTAGVLTGRFRRARQLDDTAERSRLVQVAVSRAKQGDREAIRYLYVQYADNVYGYVLSVVRDEHEAEDVTQHVFAKLMTVLHKYEPREVPFSAWILRVARNVAVDHVRQRRPMPCEEVRSPDAHDDHDAGTERSLSIREALATLPDEQREVIYLRHVVGLSPGEIAHRLGRTEPSIHGLHHRGRSALRTALTEYGAAPVTLAS